MKRIIAFTFALILTSASALAADLKLTGCTADKKETILAVTLTDDASATIRSDYQKAFAAAAASLDFENLSGDVGFRVFVSALSESDKEAFQSFPDGPPALTGHSCK